MSGLNGRQFEELSQVLLDAFDFGSLSIMVQTKLEEPLETISRGKNRKEDVANLINWAQQRGQAMLDRLISGAAEVRPQNSAVQDFAAKYRLFGILSDKIEVGPPELVEALKASVTEADRVQIEDGEEDVWTIVQAIWRFSFRPSGDRLQVFEFVERIWLQTRSQPQAETLRRWADATAAARGIELDELKKVRALLNAERELVESNSCSAARPSWKITNPFVEGMESCLMRTSNEFGIKIVPGEDERLTVRYFSGQTAVFDTLGRTCTELSQKMISQGLQDSLFEQAVRELDNVLHHSRKTRTLVNAGLSHYSDPVLGIPTEEALTNVIQNAEKTLNELIKSASSLNPPESLLMCMQKLEISIDSLNEQLEKTTDQISRCYLYLN